MTKSMAAKSVSNDISYYSIKTMRILSIFLFYIFFAPSVFGQKNLDFKLKQVSYSDTLHGREIPDPYHWIEELDSPDVLRFIKKENKEVKNAIKKVKKIENQYNDDKKKRHITSFPNADITRNPNDTYYYYNRKKGKSILYCRKTKDNKEEVILDTQIDLKGLSNDYKMVNYKTCPADKRIAYLACNDDLWFSDNNNTILRIRQIDSHQIEDQLTNVYFDFVWIDEQTIAYRQKNPLGGSRFLLKVYKHTIGMPQSTDVLIYEKNHDELSIDLYLSDSREYLFIGSLNNHTSEYYFYDIANSRLNRNSAPFYVIGN